MIVFVASCKEKSSNNPSVLTKTKQSPDTLITVTDTTKKLISFLPTNSHDSTKAGAIKDIQKNVLDIEQKKIKDTLELDSEEFLDHSPDGGGSLTGYFDSGKLVKMKLWIGLSYGVTETSYYYKNDKFIYALETAANFALDSSGSSFDYNKPFVDHFERNSYFDNGAFLQSSYKGEKRFEDENTNFEKQLLNDAVDFKKILLKHRNKK